MTKRLEAPDGNIATNLAHFWEAAGPIGQLGLLAALIAIVYSIFWPRRRRRRSGADERDWDLFDGDVGGGD